MELDLRDRAGQLILQHEPFIGGCGFEEYLARYRHGTMIVNVKCERIEFAAIELLKKFGIKNYFFLDSSFPMIYLLTREKGVSVAVRFSELEKIDTVMAMKDRVEWVWIDCFTRLPLDRDNYKLMKEAGFKLCLVSPELQGQEEKIEKYAAYLREENIRLDAVCAKIKNVPRWKTALEL